MKKRKTWKIVFWCVLVPLCIGVWGNLFINQNTFLTVKVGQIWMEVDNVDNPYVIPDTIFKEILDVNGRYCKYKLYHSDSGDARINTGEKRFIKWGAKRIKL